MTEWDTEQCAQFLRYCRRYFVNEVSKRADFPRPVAGTHRKPLWRAAAVREWAVRQCERKAA